MGCPGTREIFTGHEETNWLSEAVFPEPKGGWVKPKSNWDEKPTPKAIRFDWALDVVFPVAWFSVVFWPLWLMLIIMIWG